MKTKWLASREFSARPGRALATVGRAGRVLVTANGKPKAIMIPTSEATFAHDLEMLDRVALAQSVASIRADSVLKGTDVLTMEDISAEVAAVRAARKNPGRAAITSATRAEVKKLVAAGKTGVEVAKALRIQLPEVQNIKKALKRRIGDEVLGH